MSSRRKFIQIVPVAAATLFAGRSALAQAKIDEADAQAKALAYVHDATKVDKAKQAKYAAGQNCANCQLYQGKPTDAWGGCPLFAGKQVAGKGWCSAYVKKA
jgi:High potential iron-sulfur protein